MNSTAETPTAPLQFVVRKGKWVFRCAIECEPHDLESQRSQEFVPQLTSGDVQVTKRVSLAELQGIIAASETNIPEFFVSPVAAATIEDATGFAQFRHYLSSLDRAGVATLTPQYWLIFLPDVDDRRLKCLVVQRSASAQPPAPPMASTSSSVPDTVPVTTAQTAAASGKEDTDRVELDNHIEETSSAVVAQGGVEAQQPKATAQFNEGDDGASSWSDLIRVHRTFHAAQYLIHARPLEAAAKAKRVKYR